jgi:peptidylamidoglycolate lyase
MFRLVLLFLCVTALAHDKHVPSTEYRPAAVPLEIGEGEFRYRLVPGWASKNKRQYPIGNGKAIVEDGKGRLYFLNGSRKNCVVVLNAKGDVLDVWGRFAKSAHGLTLVREGDQEYLFIADNSANGKVFKTTLDGRVLLTIPCPTGSGLYPDPNKFKPAEVITTKNGDIFGPDGYGSDFILRFDRHGKYLSAFGGNLGKGEAQLAHWGPHGGIVDYENPRKPILILGLSDQQKIKRFTLDGKWIDTIPMPGGNPRDIVFHRGHIYVPHLGDDWPKTRNNPGYVSVLDQDFRVVANLGGKPAKYVDGKLQPMQHNTHAFYHPHGICLAKDGSLYVAQDASNSTYPLKFVPVR